MVRYSRTWVMVALALGVAGTALWVRDRDAPPPVPDVPAPRLEGEPDMLMAGALVSQYRADGTLEYRLAADEIRHFDRDAETRLTVPRLTLHDADGAPWQASALSGSLHRPATPDGEDEVTLRDEVTLEQRRSTGEYTRLVTPVLRLYPGRQYAETDQDVMIENQVGRTTATGLQGDLGRGLLELFSTSDAPVYTVLQPDQFK